MTECRHDWMRMGSREVCLNCNKARMRKDLPDWEVKNGQVVRKSPKKLSNDKGSG